MEKTSALRFTQRNQTFAWKTPFSNVRDYLGALDQGEPCIVLDDENPEDDFACVISRLGVCFVWRTDLE